MPILCPEELLNKIKSRYALSMIASRRTRELTEGAKPLVEIASKNPLDIALAEIAAGKIKSSLSKPLSLPKDRREAKS